MMRRSEREAACRAGLEHAAQLAARGLVLEAHEAFESLWRAAPPEHAPTLRALAQWMAVYRQAELGRGRAAARTWAKARPRLRALGAITDARAQAVDTWLDARAMRVEGERFVAPPASDEAPLPELEVIAASLAAHAPG